MDFIILLKIQIRWVKELSSVNLKKEVNNYMLNILPKAYHN
jgi:hypothetical protein